MLNPLNLLEKIRSLRHPALRDILSGFNGVVRPGEMLRTSPVSLLSCAVDADDTAIPVVLGRPGAGCSTLLRTLANQRDEYYAVEGEVHYDALDPGAVKKYYRGDVQYSPEDDVHFPTLTVGQTLDFAAATRAPHTRLPGASRADYTRQLTDILTTVFGLRHVRDTLVGDAAVRGVSGGEKKRVSISEALATRSVINSWDK